MTAVVQTDSGLQGHANRLSRAYRAGAIEPVRHALTSATVEDAYAVQAINTDRWLGEGRVVVGAKIGLTSRAVQKQLGVGQPDFGMLFADMAI